MPEDNPVTESERQAASQALLQTRSDIRDLQPPPESGVYAIYLRTKGLLRPFDVGEDGLIYIGLSTNLAEREFDQHFSSENTGFSTLRRSLGAILKQSLTLQAIPRSPGPSKSNYTNYCFVSDGEIRLTELMWEHLEVGFYACRNYRGLEKCLLADRVPLLNLTNCPNLHRSEIKRLRKMCADEARQTRQCG